MKRRIVIEFETDNTEEGEKLYNVVSEATFNKWERTSRSFPILNPQNMRETVR